MGKFWAKRPRLGGKGPKIWCIKGKHLVALGCVVVAAVMFAVVNHPSIVGASAATRELPIYCVQRDQKMASLTFDAAWGDAIIRSLRPKASRGRNGRILCQDRI